MMKLSWLVFVFLGWVALTGCDSDDGSDEDMGADMADVQDDSSIDMAADVPSGSGTISASVLWNLGVVPDGSLTVALYTTNPPTGTADFEQIIDPVDMLPTTITFEDVPLGVAYYLVAFLDADRDSSVEAPGPGDFLTVTMDAVGVDMDGATTSAAVELR